MEQDVTTLVRQILTDDAIEVRTLYLDALADSVDEFIPMMAAALDACNQFYEFASGNDDREKVYWLLYSAVQLHLISMRLLLDGLLVPSGNLQRQVLESIAVALLASKPELGILERFSEGKYSSSKAIQDVIRNAEALNIVRPAMELMKKSAQFYDQFSHPSLMTIASFSSFEDSNSSYIGGSFDPAKLKQYRIQSTHMVQLARLLPGVILGVKDGMEDPPKQSD